MMPQRLAPQPVAEPAGVMPAPPVPAPPAWVRRLIGAPARAPRCADDVEVVGGGLGAILSASISGAVALAPDDLESRVEGVYGRIAAALDGAGRPLFPVRFWNFIPAIHAPMRRGRGSSTGDPRVITRYMVFNAGRFRAFRRWPRLECGGAAPGNIATATGVGHAGPDLAVHCLALAVPGEPVENPRQVPAYRYSARFGPLPPYFARGMLVSTLPRPLLLIGGTASVRGEESILGAAGDADLRVQVRETLLNLESLIQAAAGLPGTSLAPRAVASPQYPTPLSRLLEVRVYYLRPEHRAPITALLADVLPPTATVEFIRADICRPELLVEIEGLADAGPTPE